MNKYGEVTLYSQAYQKDSIGQLIPTDSAGKTIQCTIESIGRGEWLTAQQAGYQAEIKATVFAASYDGEAIAQYMSKRYVIYRTYQSGDQTELYLGTRIGEIVE